MEITQVLLVITVLVLTTIISLVGVEVFLILREVRESVRKMNKMLDDMGIISESIAKPISGLSDLASGIEGIVKVIRSFVGEKAAKKNTEEKVEDPSSDDLPKENPSRRFFLRAGKKLS